MDNIRLGTELKYLETESHFTWNILKNNTLGKRNVDMLHKPNFIPSGCDSYLSYGFVIHHTPERITLQFEYNQRSFGDDKTSVSISTRILIMVLL